MALISINNLTFHYDGSYDNVFTDVSFNIDSDWKLGLIGRNGRGKTTLLNLLVGNYSYKGSISAPMPFMYFPFPIKDEDMLPLDILYMLFPDTALWQLEKELAFLDVDTDIIYRPFNTLSGGERTKLMLAMLFTNDDRFLLIDEPTNNLDVYGRKVVSDYLNLKKGFIVVSHDRTFLNSTIDYTLSINKTTIDVVKGNYDVFEENKNRHENFELTQNEKLKHQIKEMKRAAAQTEDWSLKAESAKFGKNEKSGLKPEIGYVTRKAAKMMKKSKILERRMENNILEKESLLKDMETIEKITLSPLDTTVEIFLRFRDLSINYDDKIVFAGLNEIIYKGDRVLLKGSNGSGKSSLLNLILGKNIPYTGDFHINNRLDISYVPQMTSLITGNIDDFIEKENINKTLFMTILRKMGFNRVQFEKDFSDYSEGQKKKVLISKSLCQPAHLFIWDEPLNYIDLHSRIQIENAILEFNPTIIFVEHDISFSDKIATKIIDLDTLV